MPARLRKSGSRRRRYWPPPQTYEVVKRFRSYPLFTREWEELLKTVPTRNLKRRWPDTRENPCFTMYLVIFDENLPAHAPSQVSNPKLLVKSETLADTMEQPIFRKRRRGPLPSEQLPHAVLVV